MLNSNIRCIEIDIANLITATGVGLIVTLDVLKFTEAYEVKCSVSCWIVTLDVLKWDDMYIQVCVRTLNSNIRCIEIKLLERSKNE